MVNDEETLTINQDALGRWTVLYHTNTNNYSQNLGNVTDIRQAFAASDAWVQEHRPSSLSLLDSAAAWRSDSPTPSQIRALKRIGITPTPEMTKGFVSQILSKHYEKNPRPAWLQKKIKSKKSVY
jgi:hypothetical protein